MACFASSLTQYKGTTSVFFNAHPTRCVYDIIYVDASHDGDDVIMDAIQVFECLKVGDDYF